MATQDATDVQDRTAGDDAGAEPQEQENRQSVWATYLSPKNIGAVYVLILLIIVASIVLPDTFPTIATVKQVANNNALTALAALALVVPLCAGVFDLSFAYTMSLSGVTVTHFVVHGDIGIVPVIVIAVLIGLGIGIINGIVVVVMRIDSFIGTLATGSLIAAFITFVTDNNAITSVKLLGTFSKLGQYSIAGFTLPVFYALALAGVLWYLLEQTATGRRLYSVGFNRDAASLAGIRTERLRFGSLITSGVIAGFAGAVLASYIGSGSPESGNSYLLPAFTCAFLGATQLKPGRFNAWGTILGVVLLGTGLTALALDSAPNWAGDMFTGVVLIAALAVAGSERRGGGVPQLRRLRLKRSKS